MRKDYPKKCVDGILTWLGEAKILVDSGNLLREMRARIAEPRDGDVLAKRDQLFDSREEILRCVQATQQVYKDLASIGEFLGPETIVIVDDADCDSASNQHSVWFTALQAATRHSTSMVHALQMQIAEGAKSFLGSSDASTAAALSQQWAATRTHLTRKNDFSEITPRYKCCTSVRDACLKPRKTWALILLDARTTTRSSTASR